MLVFDRRTEVSLRLMAVVRNRWRRLGDAWLEPDERRTLFFSSADSLSKL